MASWDSPDPKLHGAIWRRVRKQCFDRDLRNNAPCHICGQEIDYTAKHGSHDAWEPDHVIPRSKRPDLIYDMANIKASHASCNRSRGNKSLNANKQSAITTSRNWI